MTNPDKNGRNSDGTFAKGNPGGPGRPPKEMTIPDLLREILDEEIDGQSRKKIILKKVVQKAYEGERWAVEFCANRLEGTPIATMRTQEIDKDEVIDI
jgi:hypothetical protein